MLHSIDSRQFNEWLAEYKIQPWDIESEFQSEDKPSSISQSLKDMRRMTGV